MKAVLGNRILMNADANSDLAKSINTELTYSIPRMTNCGMGRPEIIKNMLRVTPKLISIPSGREDLIPEDYKVIDKRCNVTAKFPEFKFELRPSQKKIYDEVNESGILVANPSWGKFCSTIM